MMGKFRGNILLLITALVWGASFVSQSVGMDYIGANTFNCLRTLLGGLVLIPVILCIDAGKKKQGTFVSCDKKKLLLYGTVCGFLLCAATTLQNYGLKLDITAGESGFLTALYIVFVAVLGVFCGKKLSVKIVLGVLLSVLGMYYLCLFGASMQFQTGHLLTILCAVLFAFHILCIDKFSPNTDGVKLACTQFLISGALSFIAMVLFESPNWDAIFSCATSILYSGVMSCGVAYTLQIVGQKYTDPTSASMLMSLESVFAALAGWVLLGENMTPAQISGCVMMFAAVILVQLPQHKKI